VRQHAWVDAVLEPAVEHLATLGRHPDHPHLPADPPRGKMIKGVHVPNLAARDQTARGPAS